MTYVPRLKTKYKEEIRTTLKDKFQYKSVMQVPKLEKIAINQGVGGATTDKKLIENAITEMTTITGQQAIAAKSKKDISNFKLRKGMPIGVRVTLRDNTMYEFLDRLIAVALPRIRDFKGSAFPTSGGTASPAMITCPTCNPSGAMMYLFSPSA